MTTTTKDQRLWKFAIASYLVSHYKLNALDRQLDLAKMREIVDAADRIVMPEWPPLDDQYLDSPQRHQSAEINARR